MGVGGGGVWGVHTRAVTNQHFLLQKAMARECD